MNPKHPVDFTRYEPKKDSVWAEGAGTAGAGCSPQVCIRPSTAQPARNLRPDMSRGAAGCTSRKQVQFGTKRNRAKIPNVWDF